MAPRPASRPRLLPGDPMEQPLALPPGEIQQLPAEITLSFSPYSNRIEEWVAMARAANSAGTPTNPANPGGPRPPIRRSSSPTHRNPRGNRHDPHLPRHRRRLPLAVPPADGSLDESKQDRRSRRFARRRAGPAQAGPWSGRPANTEPVHRRDSRDRARQQPDGGGDRRSRSSTSRPTRNRRPRPTPARGTPPGNTRRGAASSWASSSPRGWSTACRCARSPRNCRCKPGSKKNLPPRAQRTRR